jgi:hypothetical protein
VERIKTLVAIKGLFTNQEKIGTQKWFKKIKNIICVGSILVEGNDVFGTFVSWDFFFYY